MEKSPAIEGILTSEYTEGHLYSIDFTREGLDYTLIFLYSLIEIFIGERYGSFRTRIKFYPSGKIQSIRKYLRPAQKDEIRRETLEGYEYKIIERGQNGEYTEIYDEDGVMIEIEAPLFNAKYKNVHGKLQGVINEKSSAYLSDYDYKILKNIGLKFDPWTLVSPKIRQIYDEYSKAGHQYVSKDLWGTQKKKKEEIDEKRNAINNEFPGLDTSVFSNANINFVYKLLGRGVQLQTIAGSDALYIATPINGDMSFTIHLLSKTVSVDYPAKVTTPSPPPKKFIYGGIGRIREFVN